MNAKAKGTRNEHRSMSLLEGAGYRCTRSAASLGEWDIIGVGKHDVVLVQVKTNKWPSRAELSRLQEFEVPSRVTKLVHKWVDRQRRPHVIVLQRAAGTPWPDLGTYDNWGAPTNAYKKRPDKTS